MTKNKSENFSFKELLEGIIDNFPERSQDIIKMRFGIGKKKYTLNSIGNKYGITRERVRQIIKESVNKASKGDSVKLIGYAEKKIIFTIDKNNGIMVKEQLLSSLGNDEQEKGSIEFFLECIKSVSFVEKKGEICGVFVHSDFCMNTWKKINDATKKFLEKNKNTLTDDEFFEYAKTFLKKKVSKDAFLSYMEASEEIRKNAFGKWGLSKWSEISPKGARQKAYLVMREIGKPLHFRKVAELIDEYELSKRKSHPQTVHNELIKDKKFVLVGRGVYALSEWGYEKGTVKEVLEGILSKNKKPMKRSDILDQALAVRKVKKSTIVINLNNFFERVEGDMYALRRIKK